MNKKREVTLPTVVGLLVAISGLVSGLWLLKGQIGQGAKAVAEETPVGVKITNIGDVSFTVSWITERAGPGFLQYGEGESNLDLVVSDERDQQKGLIENYFTHYVVVRGLKPQTKYKFRVGSGNNVYDQHGQPYETETGKTIANPPPADVAYGQVITDSGEPAEGAIVYLKMEGVSAQSALVKTSGSWVLPLSTARSESLDEYVNYDKQNAQMELSVVGGPMGISNVVLTSVNDSPVPNITLGENYDYTAGGLVTKPEQPQESKFSAQSLMPATEVTGSGPLILLTPKFGEKVNSARPEIIGEAPAGTEVQIEIRSNPVTGKTTAGSNGKFSFSVPADLPPGEHTVTVSALINGVVRKVTRSFTVYAQGESELPFFTATPSANLVPSVSPTATPKPSPTANPSPTGKPTVVPSVAVSPTAVPTATLIPSPTSAPVAATNSGLLQSGNETPTLILLLASFVLVTVGAWWYRRVG